jgi:hypothetical protein
LRTLRKVAIIAPRDGPLLVRPITRSDDGFMRPAQIRAASNAENAKTSAGFTLAEIADTIMRT